MTHVLTLIGAPGAQSLTEALVRAAAHALPGAETPRWLAQGDACDVGFSPPGPGDIAAIEQAVRATLASAPVDAVILPAAGRRKKLLVADMDSTIIRQECIDEIADFAGLKSRIAAITGRAMRGEIEFEPALRERVGLLAGLDEAVLQQVIDERIELMPGARTLVGTMRANGAFCALVSGGFSFFTSRVGAMAGFDADQANELEIEGGKLTGRVCEPILGRDAKLQALRRYRDARGLDASETMAIGDGANDLAMIAEAGLGVAYRAKPMVAAQAAVRIEHGDLTALLYIQGYAVDAFDS